MGFEKFPHVPNLGPIVERKIGETVVGWVKSRKPGLTPTQGCSGFAINDSSTFDGPGLLRKLFPHMYSAYVITVTGSLHRCKNDKDAMVMTANAIQPGAALDGYDVSNYEFRGHSACLVNPGNNRRAAFDAQRQSYGLSVPTDPLAYAYIFDPWKERSPKVYHLDGWESCILS